MRFIEIPALITEDIEDPSIVEITEPITVSISGTTMTIDGGSKVSGEASVTLTGDVTVNAFTLQNVKQPSIHKISVKTGRKGNFTYVPNITVTASSVSTTTKTGSDFEILLITTTGGETYVDFDMADYVSPALYTSNALTGFDISELTSTYGATAKLYKPDGTLLTTVTSATTGDGVNFGYTESTPQDVTYTLEVEDDLGRTSRYDLPRKWISYAMSSPGFEKLALAGNEYTSTTIVPNLTSTSKVRVHKTGNHGYLGINFKIQGRNTTNGAWVDIDDTGENENDDESKEFLAFGDYLYHRVWVKPTAKATTTVSSSNVVTLTLSNLTEENVTTSFTGADPFDLNESTNTYVFEETTKIGTVPYTVTLGSETYTNAVTATTEGTAYDYVTLAFANPTLSLTTSNVTISSAKLYRDDVLFHTYGTESNVVLRTDQTGTYQAVVNDVYYSNRVTPDFTTTRSVSAPQLEFDGYNKLTFFKETLIQNNVIVTDTRTGGAWGCHLNIDANYTGEGYQWKLHKDDSSHSLVPDHDFDDDSGHGIYRYLRYTGTEDLGSWTFYNVNTDDSQGSQDTVLKIYSSNGSNEVTNAGIGSTLWVWSWNMSFSGHLTKSIFTPTSTTLGLPDGTTRDLTTQSNVYIYEPGTYTANVQTSETFAYLSNVATIQTVTQPTLVNTIPITAGDFSGYNYQHEATDTTNTYYEYNMSLNSTGSTYFIAYNWTTKKWFDTNPTDANNTFGISATDTAATSRETTENPKVVYVIGTNNGQIVLESQFINPYFTGPSLTFDGFNKLTIENLTQTSSTLKYGSNTYDTNTASNVYVTDAGEYKLEARDANTFVMSNVYVGGVSQHPSDVVPTLTFDGYNKLTIDNVDTVETATIKKDGVAFATTTSNTVYIRDTGTYTAEVKGSNAYAIELSNVVSGSVNSQRNATYKDFIYKITRTTSTWDNFDRTHNPPLVMSLTTTMHSTLVTLGYTEGFYSSAWYILESDTHDFAAYRHGNSVVHTNWGTDGTATVVDGTDTAYFTRTIPSTVVDVSGTYKVFSGALLTFDGYNKITVTGTNYEDTATVTYYSNAYNLGTAKTMYVKDTGEYVFKISGSDKYVESNVYVSSVDLAGATTKPIDFDGYNKLTLIDAGSNVSANVTYFSNTYELGSANVLYINGAGTYDLEMSGSNVFALSSNVVGAISTGVIANPVFTSTTAIT